MTALDWIIVVFTLVMALWGYAQGLIVGALSLGGFAAGAFVGSRLGPLLLAEGAESPYAPLFALIGALMVGGILASGLELVDDPHSNRYPMPLNVAGKDNCQVGRLRLDCALENGLSFWVSGDQLLKGAALNAVQIAELL